MKSNEGKVKLFDQHSQSWDDCCVWWRRGWLEITKEELKLELARIKLELARIKMLLELKK